MPLILRPIINSVTITPNSVNTNTTFLISVSVSEAQVEVEQVVIRSGTIKANEEGDVS